VTRAEFANLIEDIRPELVRIASRRGGRDQAEDAVQKTFMQLWASRKWEKAAAATVAGWLRWGVKREGGKEMRGLQRLRDAQRNLWVLGNKGCRHIESKPNSDGEATNK
jgi:DNA-directed RNA polymerase specialized sigma24 family protein